LNLFPQTSGWGFASGLVCGQKSKFNQQAFGSGLLEGKVTTKTIVFPFIYIYIY
jgi:hypothetical protein